MTPNRAETQTLEVRVVIYIHNYILEKVFKIFYAKLYIYFAVSFISINMI